MIPMHGQINAQEIFRELCGAIEDAGLSWKRFAGITTDGAPSMTGRKNGLVALDQIKLEGENVEEAIALHCIIHQQALCGKCLRFDNVCCCEMHQPYQIQGLKPLAFLHLFGGNSQNMKMCSTSQRYVGSVGEMS